VQDDNDRSISPVEQIARLLYDRVIEDANRDPSPVREFVNEQYENQWWHAASSEEITKRLQLEELINNYLLSH
jgi:hypothetical protein